MPYNGAGVFQPLARPVYPPLPAEVIRSDYYRQVIQDLMDGLTNTLTRDGQSPPTANLPMGTKKFTGAAAGSASGEFVTFEQLSVPSATTGAGAVMVDLPTGNMSVRARLLELQGVQALPVTGLAAWTDITTQLAAAEAIGGLWIIPPGNFEFSYISVSHHAHFMGAGDLTVLRRKANTDTTGPNAASAIGFRITAHNTTLTLSHMKLDGNEANQITEAYGYLAGFANVTGSAGQDLHLICDNVTFVNATQACIRADGDTASSGREYLTVVNCRFKDGRAGAAAGDSRFVSTSGYGPDYITLTDKTYLHCSNNFFIYEKALTSIDFGRTAIRITFDVNTTNEDGARATIANNTFIGCGRGERGTIYGVTGGSGTGAKFIPTALTGTGISTAVLLYGGTGYTVGDVLTLTGGATVSVVAVTTAGTITSFTLLTAGSGYVLPSRPVNDVGVVDFYARGRCISVTGNRFESCIGTPIRGKTNCDLVVVSGNIISDCGLNPAINIGPNSYAEQNGKIIITSNNVDICAVFGIAVVGNAGATTSGPPNTQGYVADVVFGLNSVSNVYNWNSQLNPVTGTGIYSRNFARVSVLGNQVNAVEGVGYILRGQAGTYNSVDCTVIGNTADNTGANGFTIDSAMGTWTVLGNSARDTKGRGMDVQATSGAGGVLIYGHNVSDSCYDYGHYQRFWNRSTISSCLAQNIQGTGRGFYPQDSGITIMTANTANVVTTALFGGGVSQSAIREYGNSWNPAQVYGTAAPIVGDWLRGDIVWNTLPASAGFIGWVCTASGTPGTWATFGPIT